MIRSTKVEQRNITYKDVSDMVIDLYVTEWDNGDGFDISFCDDKNNCRNISLSWEDFNALSMVIQSFNVEAQRGD